MKIQTKNQELFKIYKQTGDIRVRNQLVEVNLDCVKKIANVYSKKSKETFEDLFQVGVIGLIKAVETYDPSRKIKFTPFAFPKIRGEILHWLRDKGHLIRIPPQKQELHQKIKKYSESNKISYEKAARKLDIPKEIAKELSEIYLQNFSPIIDDLEATSYSDMVEIPLMEILSVLPEDLRLVISCRMLQEMTIKDTAACLGLKLNNVKALEKQAIELLQKEYCNVS